MVKNYLIYLLLILSCTRCLGQEEKRTQQLKQNKLDISGVMIGYDYQSIVQHLGKPDSVVHYYSEVIPEDSLRYVYYSNSYYNVTENRVVSFLINDQQIKGKYPVISIGENIETFLKQYNYFEYNSYIPSGENYRIYSFIVNDKNIKYTGEFRIVVENSKIVKFYYWIPY